MRLKFWMQFIKNPCPTDILPHLCMFLAENRGHYMIENIIEDGLWDFFSIHLCSLSGIR